MSNEDSRNIHEHHQQERVRGSSSNNDNTSDESRAAEVDRQLRDASERLFFVFPELRAAFLEPTISSRTATALILQQQEATGQPQQYPPPPDNNSNHIPTSTSTIMSTMERQTGVLWKRRDVFKNRWRPRWFSLNPGQGVLTYYLLSTTTSAAPLPTTTVPVGTDSNTHTDPSQRHRATSWDSQVSAVSENSLDYDVVPRGTIYLLGCTVAINEHLSRPNENLYAFTIRPPSAADSNIHLAARTAEARDVWVSKMDRVCRIGTAVSPSTSSSLPPSPTATLQQRPPRPARTPRSAAVNGHSRRRLSAREDSIPEGDLENSTSEPEITEHDENDAELPEESLLEDDENDVIDDEEASHEWRATGLTSSLYENVPTALAARIQETLQRHLPLILDEYNHDDNHRTNIPWKLLFHHRDTGHRAYEWIDNNNNTGRSMIQSQAVLNVPPKQVFALLVDVARRPDFETNVRVGERVRQWNAHTFCDYYAYNAVRASYLRSEYYGVAEYFCWIVWFLCLVCVILQLRAVCWIYLTSHWLLMIILQ